MPLYDFACRKCGHEYEAILKIADPDDHLECPKCGAKDSKKLATAFRTNNWSKFLDDMEKRVNPHKFK
jgi:putative FmdB family regulatory protein